MSNPPHDRGPGAFEPARPFDGVSKTFQIPQEKVHTLKERALHPLRRSGTERFQALNDISFSVEHGEFFGIVGRNGSGKSTLLKCLAGIYGTDRGAIYVNGRMSTFIELGVGFNPDLAARDNAVLNAIMLGLSRREAQEAYHRILDFSELHEFSELKIKNYSSGMLVRLAFSVMIQVKAEILLIDEVLAVGDASFQQKCFDEFNRLRDERRTMLLVTHDMSAVARYCDRAMLIEQGDVRVVGDPDRVGAEYFEMNFGRGALPAESGEPGSDPDRQGDGRANIHDAWFCNEHGERTENLPQGRPCSFHAAIHFNVPVERPMLSVAFEDAEHRVVFATSSMWHEAATGDFHAGEDVVLRVDFENAFSPGRWFATPAVARQGGGGDYIDRRRRMISAVVTGSKAGGGLVDLPHDLRLERAGGAAPVAPS